MILIADSGSSKTDWCCASRDGLTLIRFSSLGYNPNYISREEIQNDILKCIPEEIDRSKVEEIFFYGAGVTELQYEFMRETMRGVFPNAGNIFISMDTLASARALLGRSEGFAAILGTGTNSCYYDGENLTLNIDSLGFILGDEGSGAFMGKRLIRDFIRGDMPQKALEVTKEKIKLSGDELIDQIYTKPFPNRFCAQYSRFINENLDTDPYFRNLVEDSFRQLFANIISHYPDYKRHKFNCVGSVGYAYKEILSKIAAEFGMETGVIIKAPLERLVQYHLGKI